METKKQSGLQGGNTEYDDIYGVGQRWRVLMKRAHLYSLVPDSHNYIMELVA